MYIQGSSQIMSLNEYRIIRLTNEFKREKKSEGEGGSLE